MVDFNEINDKFIEVGDRFMQFIDNFLKDGSFIYKNRYSIAKQIRVMKIEMLDIISYDSKLYEYISLYPIDCLSIFEYYLDSKKRIQVLISAEGLDNKSVSELDTSLIGSIIKVEGIVVSISQMKIAPRKYRIVCSECKWNMEIYQKLCLAPLRIYTCPSKNCKQGSVKVDTDDCEFYDYHIIKIQDSFQVRSKIDGGIPKSINVYIDGYLAGKLKGGQKIKIIGSLLVGTTSLIMEKSKITSGFIQYIRALSFDTQNEILKEDVEQIMSFSKYCEMANSIAPQITGLSFLKKAILCQLVGGNRKKLTDGVESRSEIHILVVGDPSTGKSQLSRFIENLSRIYTYSSARGSSSVGLTAAIVHDVQTGENKIALGSLALANGGIACIDEFNNTTLQDRAGLLEVMEQQTISINKAGINTVIKSNVSVFACCNTTSGKINENEDIYNQLPFQMNLMSRFDFCFVLNDERSFSKDYEMALFLMGIHSGNQNKCDSKYSVQDIKNYIEYAKTICPVISEEAALMLENFYCNERDDFRKYNSGFNKITARQLEGIIRTSEAIAKLCGSFWVYEKHVEEAIAIYRESTYKALLSTRINNFDEPRYYRESLQVEKYIIEKYQRKLQWNWGFVVEELWKTKFCQKSIDIAIARMIGEKTIEFSEDGTRMRVFKK